MFIIGKLVILKKRLISCFFVLLTLLGNSLIWLKSLQNMIVSVLLFPWWKSNQKSRQKYACDAIVENISLVARIFVGLSFKPSSFALSLKTTFIPHSRKCVKKSMKWSVHYWYCLSEANCISNSVMQYFLAFSRQRWLFLLLFLVVAKKVN